MPKLTKAELNWNINQLLRKSNRDTRLGCKANANEDYLGAAMYFTRSKAFRERARDLFLRKCGSN
jgi:hypothetical protein